MRQAAAIAFDAGNAICNCDNPLAAAMTTHYRLKLSRRSPSDLKLSIPEKFLIHCICISASSLSAPLCKSYTSSIVTFVSSVKYIQGS